MAGENYNEEGVKGALVSRSGAHGAKLLSASEVLTTAKRNSRQRQT